MKIRGIDLGNMIALYFIFLSTSLYFMGALIFEKLTFSAEELLVLGGLTKTCFNLNSIVSLFVSGSLQHLLSNLFGMIVAWYILKDFFDNSCIAFVFGLSGIVGNIISVSVQPNVISYGASGCVMGLVGMIFARCAIIETALGFKKMNRKRAFLILFAILLSLGCFLLVEDEGKTNLIAHTVGFCSGVVSGIIAYFIREGGFLNAKKR